MDIYGTMSDMSFMADVDLSWLSFWLSRCFTWLFIAPLGRSSCLGLGSSGFSSKILRVGVSTGIGSWDYWKEPELMIVAGLQNWVWRCLAFPCFPTVENQVVSDFSETFWRKTHAASLARLNICTWKTCKAKPM